MFNFKKLKFLQFLISQKHPKKEANNQAQSPKEQNLTGNLNKNIEILKERLGTSPDIIYHQFTMGTEGRPKAVLVMVDGLVETMMVHDEILKPLMIESRTIPEKHGVFPHYDIEVIKNTLVAVSGIKNISTFEEAIDAALGGDTVLLVNGFTTGLQISTRGGENRPILEPATDSVVRGPREGFVET